MHRLPIILAFPDVTEQEKNEDYMLLSQEDHRLILFMETEGDDSPLRVRR